MQKLMGEEGWGGGLVFLYRPQVSVTPVGDFVDSTHIAKFQYMSHDMTKQTLPVCVW